MPAASSSVSATVLRAGVIAAVAATSIQTVGHLVWGYVWPSELLNADSDRGVFAWASSVATFVPAVAACCLAAFADG